MLPAAGAAAGCKVDATKVINIHTHMSGFSYENGAKELISRPNREFFFSRQKSPKVTIFKLKGKSVLFFFLYPFIFRSLPSFLYFLPVYMAWRGPLQGQKETFSMYWMAELSLRSKPFHGAKTEEQGCRRFAHAENGERAKRPPPPPSFLFLFLPSYRQIRLACLHPCCHPIQIT